MPYWTRSLLLIAVAMTMGRLLALGAPAGAAEGSRVPAARTEALPRVALELKDVTMVEAADRISAATGLRIHVPPEHEVPYPAYVDLRSDQGPRQLDYARRASFTWKNAALGTVLRDYQRAYQCVLSSNAQMATWADVGVNKVALPTGVVTQAEGFEVGLGGLTVESRGQRFANAPRSGSRYLNLYFSVRALSGDPSSIIGVGYVRATDGSGRTFHVGDEGEVDERGQQITEWFWAYPSAFPDEMFSQASMQWPYPGPQTFRVIEGDLVLSTAVRHLHHEFALPPAENRPITDHEGDLTWELEWRYSTPAGFDRQMKLTVPKVYNFLHPQNIPPVSVLLADGRRELVRVEPWQVEDQASTRTFRTTVHAHALPAPPVRLIWEPAVAATTTGHVRRVHFRVENVAAHLEGDLGTAPDPTTSKKAPAPAPKPARPARRKL